MKALITTLSSKHLTLYNRPWVTPLVAAVVLAGVGVWAGSTMERSLESKLREELTTLPEADVTALRLWLENQRTTASVVTKIPRVRSLVAELVGRRNAGASPEALVQATAQQELRRILAPEVDGYGFLGFAVVDRGHQGIAATLDAAVGHRMSSEAAAVLDQVFRGDALITRPVLSQLPVGGDGQAAPRPMMFAAAPVLDDGDEVIAVLIFSIAPERAFTRILRVARFGETGETYAFDSNGLMISDSRFDDQLKAVGLLADSVTTAVLSIDIRNPGGNMVDGFRPSVARRAQPLTVMAASAVAGNNGSDVDGYPDYRGVPVIGAWTWLPEYGFGVTTEVDLDEAYRTRNMLRLVFWSVFGVLIVSALGIVFASYVINRLSRSVSEARQLGQYKLEEKIGEGGMGKVYRASHALLRRPTAVKLLRPGETNAKGIKRFEREVRHTARLSHPNTVAVYDYGRTPDGVFYYAMEYLPGVGLDQLVDHDGPQPESRVVHILKQVCASLAEAHGAGMIHRDIKPSNIMLCERGGVFDFVKVMDFGIVRDIDQSKTLALTGVDALVGTPLYMSPESILTPKDIDGRSDLYSVGCVGYYLLTGHHVFTTTDTMDLLSRHLNAEPVPPSDRLGRPVSQDVEQLILSCLAKDLADRVPSAEALFDRCDALTFPQPWTQRDARAWWEAHAATPDERVGWHLEFEAPPETPTGGKKGIKPTLVAGGDRREESTGGSG